MGDDLNFGKLLGLVAMLVAMAALAVAVYLRLVERARNRGESSAVERTAGSHSMSPWITPLKSPLLLYPILILMLVALLVGLWDAAATKSWRTAFQTLSLLWPALWTLDILMKNRAK